MHSEPQIWFLFSDWLEAVVGAAKLGMPRGQLRAVNTPASVPKLT